MKRFISVLLLFRRSGPVLLGLFVAAWTIPTQAVSIPIDCTVEDPEAVLRLAFNQGGVVVISCDLDLQLNAPLVAAADVKIDASAGHLVLHGLSQTQLVQVSSGVNCEFTGVSFRQGLAAEGGAVLNNGTLRLTHCEFDSNTAVGVPYRITGYTTNFIDYVSYSQTNVDAIVEHQDARGGAMANHGELYATNCLFKNNRALGESPQVLRCVSPSDWPDGIIICSYRLVVPKGAMGVGGALLNNGIAFLDGIRFETNLAIGGKGIDSPIPDGGVWGTTGGRGAGGAIGQSEGVLHILNSEFLGNQAKGGQPGWSRGGLDRSDPMGALAGAVYQLGGTLEIAESQFEANRTLGSISSGGALGLVGGTAHIESSQFGHNAAILENSYFPEAIEGGGGAIYNRATLELVGSQLTENDCGIGSGGSLHNRGHALLSKVCVHGNVAKGADTSMLVGGHEDILGRKGFTSKGGGIYNGIGSELTILDSSVVGNRAIGGAGRPGPNANGSPETNLGGGGFGGGVWNEGLAVLTNVTLLGNLAIGGLTTRESSAISGYIDAWWPGPAYAGGFGSVGQAIMNHCTLLDNQVVVSNTPWAMLESDQQRTTNVLYGSTIFVPETNSFGLKLMNTAIGVGVGAPSIQGAVLDLGYNVNADSSSHFSQGSSRENLDPKLGTLADRGGPVPTVNLRVGSPCLDSAQDGPNPSTDARGVLRPQGRGPDIGAYEAGTIPELQIVEESELGTLAAFGEIGERYLLQFSRDLRIWHDETSFVLNTQGQVIRGPVPTNNASMFLRLAAQ